MKAHFADSFEVGNGCEKHYLFMLLGIVILAAVLRIYNLDSNPNGLFCDEASSGYDSYSLMLTGKDQNGHVFPLFSRSFAQDYDESLYRFINIPFIRLFGLNEFSVRIPAALAGIFTVLFVYLLALEIFKDRNTALLASLMLAISPWHVHFSRIGFRAILLPLFATMAVYLFLRSRRTAPMMLWAAVGFGLAVYSYSAARVFIPVIMGVLAILFAPELWRNRRWSIVSLGLFLPWLLLLYSIWSSPEGMNRASHLMSADFSAWIRNYLSYFSPKFLFMRGDLEWRHGLEEMGQFYRFESVSLLAGLLGILLRPNRDKLVIAMWLLLYPIPAALTAPDHALRSLHGVIPMALLSGYGLRVIALRARSARIFLIPVTVAVVAVSFGFWLKYQYSNYPEYSATEWQYGMREALSKAEKATDATIYISNDLFIPHVFVLFYGPYPPEDYQRSPLKSLNQGRWRIDDYQLGRYRIMWLEAILDAASRESVVIVTHQQYQGLMAGNHPFELLHQVVVPQSDQPVMAIIRVLPR